MRILPSLDDMSNKGMAHETLRPQGGHHTVVFPLNCKNFIVRYLLLGRPHNPWFIISIFHKTEKKWSSIIKMYQYFFFLKAHIDFLFLF